MKVILFGCVTSLNIPIELCMCYDSSSIFSEDSFRLYEVCPTLFDLDFVESDPWELCPPILIGVLRRSDEELSDCDFEMLFDGMHLIHTIGDLSLETLFDELLKFKDQFDDNEKNLVSVFLTSIVRSLI